MHQPLPVMESTTYDKAQVVWREHPTPSDHPRRYPAGPGVVFLLALLVLFLVPEVVRREAARRLEAQINAPVAIADVDLNFLTGKARVWGLVIGGGRQAVLRVPSLELTFSRRALLRREVVVHRVTVRQPALTLVRTGPTRWNIDRILRAQAEGGVDIGGLPIAHLEVQEGQVTIVDRTTTPVVKSVLRDLDLSLRPVPLTPEAEPAHVTGQARLGEGSVQMSGTLHLRPFISRLTVNATRVPLGPFQGYIHQLFGIVDSVGGEFDGRLEMTAALHEQGHLDLEARGDIEGHHVALGLPGEQEPFFHAARLTAELTRGRMMPALRVEISDVQLAEATLRITRDPQGNFPLRRLWMDSPTKDPTENPKSPAPPDAHSPLAIRHLSASDSRIVLVDRTTTPTFSGVMSDVNAKVHNSSKSDRATLTLTGNLEGSAPIALKGWFTPVGVPRKIYMEGTLEDYELSRVNPYAEKYVRHRVRRGRVSTQVKYQYNAGNLAAGNEIRIRRIKLGDNLGPEFQQQVGIPLKLALALLEGLNGEIRLRVPVRGNLDNPDFRLNSVVWKAVRNAVLKTIAAPFKLFGSIVTVGGKITEVRITPVGFAPGSVEPGPQGAAQLKQLITFLRERPKVELQLRGRASLQEAKALPPKRRLGQAATERELKQLAEDRARYIERALVQRGIAQKRLFVITDDPQLVRKKGSGRVEFRILH